MGTQAKRATKEYWKYYVRAAAMQPEAPRPAWESPAWWQAQLEQTPSAECGRNALHGICTTFTTVTRLGRTITHHCPVCGWEKPVLVQEGGLEPCVPADALPPKSLGKRGAQLTRPKREDEDF